MIIDNKLYCVIYSLKITKFDSVIPEEAIYDFILCNNGEEFYFLAIDYNSDNFFIPYIVMDKIENITNILDKVSLLTRFTKVADIRDTSKPRISLNVAKDYYIYTLNDLITIGERIDLKNYSYKITKNFKPVTYHIDMENEPININI